MHVVPVSVRVGAKVHDGSDAREGFALVAADPAGGGDLLVRRHVLVGVRHQPLVQRRDLVSQVVKVVFKTRLLKITTHTC